MAGSPVTRLHGSERGWTAHLGTDVGMRSLLGAVRSAALPAHLQADLDEVLEVLDDDAAVDELGWPVPRPSALVVHQLHLAGRYPDLVVHDLRRRPLAVVEAQRGRADDQHIARLATRYVPQVGAGLGVLLAEGWDRRRAAHPAWALCPAPVVVVVALDSLHELEYRVAWVHAPEGCDADLG